MRVWTRSDDANIDQPTKPLARPYQPLLFQQQQQQGGSGGNEGQRGLVSTLFTVTCRVNVESLSLSPFSLLSVNGPPLRTMRRLLHQHAVLMTLARFIWYNSWACINIRPLPAAQPIKAQRQHAERARESEGNFLILGPSDETVRPGDESINLASIRFLSFSSALLTFPTMKYYCV